jgi:hypothetical protein
LLSLCSSSLWVSLICLAELSSSFYLCVR